MSFILCWSCCKDRNYIEKTSWFLFFSRKLVGFILFFFNLRPPWISYKFRKKFSCDLGISDTSMNSMNQNTIARVLCNKLIWKRVQATTITYLFLKIPLHFALILIKNLFLLFSNNWNCSFCRFFNWKWFKRIFFLRFKVFKKRKMYSVIITS